jgi:hypothetical protein
LRPADFPSAEALRQALIKALAAYRFEQGRRAVADFDRERFDFAGDFYRIGGGSLGGKARGLAFVRRLLSQYRMRHRFAGVEIANPATVVLGTDAFEQFLDANDLRHFAIDCDNDLELWRRFERASLPAAVVGDLEAFLRWAAFPLAVRSSSLLEDSRQEPVTGVYDTLMLPNNAASATERLAQLLLAIKRVYASTFSRQAKAYLAATHYRLEEEKMAVMLQRIVGSVRGERFYPDFSGVARSYAFYPSPPARAEDGVAAVALGLGKGVVDGGACLRFCPRFPRHIPQLSSVADALASTQREFWALPLSAPGGGTMRERPYELEVAEADGALANLASTWSEQDDRIYDGVGRAGPRLVTFAPILKHGVFPLAEVVSTLLDLGSESMGSPVEIELAVNLHPDPGAPAELGFLQMRPLALAGESEAVEVGETDLASVVCASLRVLGNGRIDGIRDLVVVDFQRFERAQSREAAAEIGRLNALLMASTTPYILIGVGRWGSRDPWLGIPVTWSQVAGARVIVEAGLRDLRVTPSQGSHFFHNLTSFRVGYFTVNAQNGEGFVDWKWLDAQPAQSHSAHVRHLRLDRPVVVKMNGKLGEGVILKPE